MNKPEIRAVQRKLAEMGHYSGKVDGVRGPKTRTAVLKGLRDIPGDKPAGIENWSAKRRIVAFLQLYAQSEGIEAGAIDGYWGPQTDFAADALVEKLTTGTVPNWRDIVPGRANPNNFPEESGVHGFYGPPGKKNGSFRPPLVSVPLPWRMKLAWNGSQSRRALWVHEKAADSLKRVLAKIEATYSDTQRKEIGIDVFGGDYAPRRIRGGTRPSLHSWGIAFDFDPERNQLRWNSAQARLAQRDCTPFWEAWESEGWCSLGRERNFDWMHVQAAKRT